MPSKSSVKQSYRSYPKDASSIKSFQIELFNSLLVDLCVYDSSFPSLYSDVFAYFRMPVSLEYTIDPQLC